MHTGLCETSPGTKGPDCRPARQRDVAAATRHYRLTRPDLRYRRRAALPALQQVPVSSPGHGQGHRHPRAAGRHTVRLTGRDPDTAAAAPDQISLRRVIHSRSHDSDHADETQGPQNEMICRPSPVPRTHLHAARSRQEDGDRASDTPRLPWICGGTGVVSGSGTRPDPRSADAVSGCPATGVSAGSQSWHHRRCRSDLPGLGKRPGFTGPTASGCVPSLNQERDGHDQRRRQDLSSPAAWTRTPTCMSRPRSIRSAGCWACGSSRLPRPGMLSLLSWLRSFGVLAVAGVEGTGSYGAGLARHLAAASIRVVEVDRADRQDRHRQGKSDPSDAVSAARAA